MTKSNKAFTTLIWVSSAPFGARGRTEQPRVLSSSFLLFVFPAGQRWGAERREEERKKDLQLRERRKRGTRTQGKAPGVALNSWLDFTRIIVYPLINEIFWKAFLMFLSKHILSLFFPQIYVTILMIHFCLIEMEGPELLLEVEERCTVVWILLS